jgi:hypothetical protein
MQVALIMPMDMEYKTTYTSTAFWQKEMLSGVLVGG